MTHVVLGLLLLRPRTLYELNKEFQQTISLFYRASLGGLRSALGRLVERGEAEFDELTEGGRYKKIYRPSALGEQAFFEWLRSPITGGDAETAMLSRLFFLGMLPDAGQRSAVLAAMSQRIAQDKAELDALDAQLDQLRVPPEAELVFRYQRATLDYGIAAHESAAAVIDRLCTSEG